MIAFGHKREYRHLNQVFLTEPVTWLDAPPDRRELVETVRAVLKSPR